MHLGARAELVGIANGAIPPRATSAVGQKRTLVGRTAVGDTRATEVVGFETSRFQQGVEALLNRAKPFTPRISEHRIVRLRRFAHSGFERCPKQLERRHRLFHWNDVARLSLAECANNNRAFADGQLTLLRKLAYVLPVEVVQLDWPETSI